MAWFRKRPVVIEARQVPRTSDDITRYLEDGIALAEWCGGVSYLMTQGDEPAYRGCEFIGPHISIRTLEGTHAAEPGDWIIRGVAGEFYPCKPDIFEATYEPVASRAAPRRSGTPARHDEEAARRDRELQREVDEALSELDRLEEQ